MKTEEKIKAYDTALKLARDYYEDKNCFKYLKGVLENIFPELQESKDEKIRKMIINHLTQERGSLSNEDATDAIAWLEKQGKETSWKPSKEEMDVLYSLAYITNQYDERKEIVITRLYQDLKREFFNGSSYENMFPTNTSIENDVRRRSTIQVLEYARSLDAYNQFGKADIDKNITWLEKLSEKPQGKTALEAIHENKVDNQNCVKPANKVEQKFKVGDWVVENGVNGNIVQITKFEEDKEVGIRVWFSNGTGTYIDFLKYYHLWTIADAKDGDILFQDLMDGKTFIYNGVNPDMTILYSFIISNDDKDILPYHIGKPNTGIGNIEENKNIIRPATKEQRDLLFEKMKDAGYEWDAEEKELRKIE